MLQDGEWIVNSSERFRKKENIDYSFGKNLEVLMRKLRNGELFGLNRTSTDYYIDKNTLFGYFDVFFPTEINSFKTPIQEYADILVIFF